MQCEGQDCIFCNMETGRKVTKFVIISICPMKPKLFNSITTRKSSTVCHQLLHEGLIMDNLKLIRISQLNQYIPPLPPQCKVENNLTRGNQIPRVSLICYSVTLCSKWEVSHLCVSQVHISRRVEDIYSRMVQ